MKGIVFNIQRFSLFDGPGVRTVVFLKGCPLRCIWCHNPEGLERSAQILYDPIKCIACGECSAVCERHLHVFKGGLHGYMRDGCAGCGKCSEVCCTGALSTAGKQMSSDEVMGEVLRDLALYRESGGGITLSGGEPLMQPDFAIELLSAAKDAGISACVETSGFADPKKIEKAAKYTDLFLYDYKATGDEMHKKLCGVEQKRIIENLALLDRLGASVILRCPIVPGANDLPEHIAGIADTAKKYGCIKEVQLEPYHRLGVSKAEKLHKTEIYDTTPPARDYMEECCEEISRVSGKKCSVS